MIKLDVDKSYKLSMKNGTTLVGTVRRHSKRYGDKFATLEVVEANPSYKEGDKIRVDMDLVKNAAPLVADNPVGRVDRSPVRVKSK